MDSHLECCICYTTYGQQEDGSFICKDGKANSEFAETCNHYICVPCCQTLYNKVRADSKGGDWNAKCACPMCREDWTEWILRTYDDETDDETDDEEDEDTDEMDTRGFNLSFTDASLP